MNQGASPTIDGVDDTKNFNELCHAFVLLGMSEKQQDQIFRILSGILHIGNIVIGDGIGDSSEIDVSIG